MQPYILPYIGYFQLINYVDKFVFYDDVSFIKQGWINRNRFLLNNNSHYFTIQVKSASSFRSIRETEIHEGNYKNWKSKFYKTLEQAYAKAPFYQTVLPIITMIFDNEHKYISQLAINSIKAICNYLEIEKDFVDSSVVYNNSNITSQDRVLDICQQEKATHYINVQGGIKLYTKEEFAARNIDLLFINPEPIVYTQLNNEFVPWLSILDVLMFNSVDEIKAMLNRYNLS